MSVNTKQHYHVEKEQNAIKQRISNKTMQVY